MCRSSKQRFLQFSVCVLMGGVGFTAQAQSDSDLDRLAGWVAMDAPTGHEHSATDRLQRDYGSWQRDRYGNLTRTVGTGSPHRVVACGLDSFAYAVSQITAEGYLRLHRIAAGSRHPLWDQAHEGQHLRILTREGPLVGVSAIANGHFASQHQNETDIVTQNDLWLDVGATSQQQVADMGIQLLDPVVRNLPAWYYANEVAGPNAGTRLGCAAVLSAAEAGVNGGQGSTSYVLSVQHAFNWAGLAASLRWLPPPDELILLLPGEAQHRDEVVESVNSRLDAVLADRGPASIHVIAPAVGDPGALMERMNLAAANALLASVIRAIDPSASPGEWLPAPARANVLNDEPERRGAIGNPARLMAIAATLDRLAETVAVPRHEGPVRRQVYDALPEWARNRAEVDALGNLWVEFGKPDGEATVFIAHMDEVGWEIDGIAPDGTVSLARRGGVVVTAWEGQPAVLQLDPGFAASSEAEPALLRGVFLTRSNPETKQPESVSAWFGMDGAELAVAGVTTGMGVTLLKEGHRMGPYRYAARSMDDRVGVTSLLKAIQEIDPEQVASRIVFAWSVQEEGGLIGAAELAKVFGPTSRRAYSIDTFVSSDTPLESPHFAYAPLGNGPVLRSVENSSMATPYEFDRNRGIAAAAGLTVQYGLTQGGTDGTEFTFYGAPNAGLSWPGRYSHSPAEISDLRDIAGLIDLIKAMVAASP